MTALCRDVHRGYNLWDEARGCSDGNKVSPKGLCWTIEEASPLGLRRTVVDPSPLGRRRTVEEASPQGLCRTVEEASPLGLCRTVEEASPMGLCRTVKEASPLGRRWTVEEASPLVLSDCDANPLGRPLLVGAEGLRTGQQWFHTDRGISRQQRSASLGGLRFSGRRQLQNKK